MQEFLLRRVGPDDGTVMWYKKNVSATNADGTPTTRWKGAVDADDVQTYEGMPMFRLDVETKNDEDVIDYVAKKWIRLKGIRETLKRMDDNDDITTDQAEWWELWMKLHETEMNARCKTCTDYRTQMDEVKTSNRYTKEENNIRKSKKTKLDKQLWKHMIDDADNELHRKRTYNWMREIGCGDYEEPEVAVVVYESQKSDDEDFYIQRDGKGMMQRKGRKTKMKPVKVDEYVIVKTELGDKFGVGYVTKKNEDGTLVVHWLMRKRDDNGKYTGSWGKGWGRAYVTNEGTVYCAGVEKGGNSGRGCKRYRRSDVMLTNEGGMVIKCDDKKSIIFHDAHAIALGGMMIKRARREIIVNGLADKEELEEYKAKRKDENANNIFYMGTDTESDDNDDERVMGDEERDMEDFEINDEDVVFGDEQFQREVASAAAAAAMGAAAGGKGRGWKRKRSQVRNVVSASDDDEDNAIAVNARAAAACSLGYGGWRWIVR